MNPNESCVEPAAAAAFVLSYLSLRGGRTLSFPCDAAGLVTLDELSDSARYNYLLARALVGRDYGLPVVAAAGAAN